MSRQNDPVAERSPIVRLIDLHKSFGRTEVLHGITLDFEVGRTTVVMGPSGCGKSVMLKHINGLLKPTSGQVWFESSRVDMLGETRLSDIRTQIGFLFQQGALFDSMSVRDNVAFPLREHTRLEAAELDDRVMGVIEMVGLAEVAGSFPADLSGGQRKRAALARAIVLQPRLILYDEPT
ncbi:MAG: ABC transporter ATP-binding protein, partial [Planctomycetota bacterium]